MESKRYIGKEKENNDFFENYIVKEGDTLYQLSKDNNVDIDMLSKINGLASYDYLYPNQTLLIPKEDIKLYITKEGDTLKTVSTDKDVPLDTIISNNKNIYLLPNQLFVPFWRNCYLPPSYYIKLELF